MAFNGIIDAITGPSFKMPDGSSKSTSVSELLGAAKDEAVEKATVVVEAAKETVSGIMPGLSEGLNALGKAARKAIPTALAASATKEYMGGQGSFIEFMQPAYLYTSFQRMEDERHEYIGWICHRVLSLSTLSGFTLCENVQLEIAGATVDELQLIKTFMEAGVYIE